MFAIRSFNNNFPIELTYGNQMKNHSSFIDVKNKVYLKLIFPIVKHKQENKHNNW